MEKPYINLSRCKSALFKQVESGRVISTRFVKYIRVKVTLVSAKKRAREGGKTEWLSQKSTERLSRERK